MAKIDGLLGQGKSAKEIAAYEAALKAGKNKRLAAAEAFSDKEGKSKPDNQLKGGKVEKKVIKP